MCLQLIPISRWLLAYEPTHEACLHIRPIRQARSPSGQYWDTLSSISISELVCWLHQTGWWDEQVKRENYLTRRDLGRLEEWVSQNFMKFNKDVCKILLLWWHNQRSQSTMGSVWLGSICWNGSGFLLDRKLIRCQCISKSSPELLPRGVTLWQTESGAGLNTLPGPCFDEHELQGATADGCNISAPAVWNR